MKKLMVSVFGVLALLACASVSRADTIDGVTFTLVSADLTGSPGSALTWQYDVTNNSGGTISANSINAGNFTAGTPDGSVFDYFNFFAGIADGTSLVGPLYAFTADPGTPNSFNSGIFDLNVSLADGTVIDLSSNYSATISTAPVPESSVSLLLLVGISSLLVLKGFKRDQ
jgi:hypothetical protein